MGAARPFQVLREEALKELAKQLVRREFLLELVLQRKRPLPVSMKSNGGGKP